MSTKIYGMQNSAGVVVETNGVKHEWIAGVLPMLVVCSDGTVLQIDRKASNTSLWDIRVERQGELFDRVDWSPKNRDGVAIFASKPALIRLVTDWEVIG